MNRTSALSPDCLPHGAEPIRYSSIDVYQNGLIRRLHMGWERTYRPYVGPINNYVVAQAWVNDAQACYNGSTSLNSFPNAWMNWKLYNQVGNNNWTYKVDKDDDGVFESIMTCDTGFTTGLPVGRTSRRTSNTSPPDAETNAYDHPINLKWASLPGDTGWANWDTNMLYCDDMPNWKWQWEADNAYQVVSGSGSAVCP